MDDIRKSPAPPEPPRILEIFLPQWRIKNLRERGDSLLQAVTICSRAEIELLFDSVTAGRYDVGELSIPGPDTDAPYRVKLRLKGT